MSRKKEKKTIMDLYYHSRGRCFKRYGVKLTFEHYQRLCDQIKNQHPDCHCIGSESTNRKYYRVVDADREYIVVYGKRLGGIHTFLPFTTNYKRDLLCKSEPSKPLVSCIRNDTYKIPYYDKINILDFLRNKVMELYDVDISFGAIKQYETEILLCKSHAPPFMGRLSNTLCIRLCKYANKKILFVYRSGCGFVDVLPKDYLNGKGN